jgi:D-sedoheptulose 7-phosphate isomerase
VETKSKTTATTNRATQIAAILADHRSALSAALQSMEQDCAPLAAAVDLVISTLRAGRTILLAGNGGSAAEAQHFAAELVGRFRRERPAYAALALTTDTSILTAIGNDYSFADVFARQVEGLARQGDLFIAFSTSGESENLIRAIDTCRRLGVSVLTVTGNRPSTLGQAADVSIRTPAPDTATVQELHTFVTHILCDLAEAALAGDS